MARTRLIRTPDLVVVVDSDFDWSSLYDRYDAMCSRFNPENAHLRASRQILMETARVTIDGRRRKLVIRDS